VADVGGNIELKTSELRYVTAFLSPVHSFNRRFVKNGIPVIGDEALSAGGIHPV
jgi:hypothetical protein